MIALLTVVAAARFLEKSVASLLLALQPRYCTELGAVMFRIIAIVCWIDNCAAGSFWIEEQLTP